MTASENTYYIGYKIDNYACSIMAGATYDAEWIARANLAKCGQNVVIHKVPGGYHFTEFEVWHDDITPGTILSEWISPNLDAHHKDILPCDIAITIIKEHKIIRIDNRLYSYKDNYYQYLADDEIRQIIYERNKTLSKRKRDEILDCIKLEKSNYYEDSTKDYICFNNGLLKLNKRSHRLVEHNPKIICTTKIPHDFDPDLFVESGMEIHKSLQLWADGNQDIITLLLEMVGYCMTYDLRMQKAFVITGDRANGKSAFMQFLQFCLGEDNYTSVDMGDLGNRFTTIQLMDRLANISDDIADAYLSSSKEAIFKKLVTGDTVIAEKKNVDPIKFRNYATMIFTCNEKPRSADPTGALARRLIYIPFEHEFSDAERDYHIYEKLQTEENAIAFINSALIAYRAAALKGHFTITEVIDEANKEQRIANSPILRWAYEDLGASEKNTEVLTQSSISSLFEHFINWCKKNNFNDRTTIQTFSKKIRTEFGLVTKNLRISNDETAKHFQKRGKNDKK